MIVNFHQRQVLFSSVVAHAGINIKDLIDISNINIPK